MKMYFTAARMFLLVGALGASALLGSAGHAQPATAPSGQDQDPQITSGLVREIQSMLHRVGLNPGPVDGNPSARTNRAVRLFEEQHGLPLTELKRHDKVPTELLARLRDEAAAPAVPDRAGKAAAAPQISSPPPAPAAHVEEQPAPKPATDAVAPPPVESLPRNRFAACAYDLEDFHIGVNHYTPDTFLREGFDGSTVHAVADLRDRLEEGRQIADRVGVSAIPEVQRQARVLHYFECRLKIEQAAGKS